MLQPLRDHGIRNQRGNYGDIGMIAEFFVESQHHHGQGKGVEIKIPADKSPDLVKPRPSACPSVDCRKENVIHKYSVFGSAARIVTRLTVSGRKTLPNTDTRCAADKRSLTIAQVLGSF